MGNGDSTEHHYHTEVIYKIPEETLKLLDEQAKQLKAFEEEAKKRNDPKLYTKNATKLLDKFIERLPSLKLTDAIKKKTGENHIGVIGPISSGKTSFINALFGIKLKVALGNCTEGCNIVHSENENVIWDVCGTNDDYMFYDPKSLSFVASLDTIAILFDNDIAMISNMLKVINAINPNAMVVIRTKVDQHNSLNIRSVTEEVELDKSKLNCLLGRDIKVYCISSLNILNKTGYPYDWKEVRSVLKLAN